MKLFSHGGREFVTSLGVGFHPRFMKKYVMSLLKVMKHCTCATGNIVTAFDHEPQNYWIFLKTVLGLWPTAAVILTICPQCHMKKYFFLLTQNLYATYFNEAHLFFSFCWENSEGEEMAVPVLFMLSVIINISIQSPSYKQNNPTLQSLICQAHFCTHCSQWPKFIWISREQE